ncbi:MAG TPA: hypothetical protein PK151_05330 [Caldisericia bacterium]|nr:hypothetical protein [Caldisericia bacterium]
MKAGKDRVLLRDVKEVENKKQNDWTPVEKLEISVGIVVSDDNEAELKDGVKVYTLKGVPLKVTNEYWSVRLNEILAYGE